MNFENRNAGDNKRHMKKNLGNRKGDYLHQNKRWCGNKEDNKSKNGVKNYSTDDDENEEREFNSGNFESEFFFLCEQWWWCWEVLDTAEAINKWFRIHQHIFYITTVLAVSKPTADYSFLFLRKP